jgi:LysM repeat protein
VFTPNTSTILAGSFGEVETWHTFLTVVNPRFFSHGKIPLPTTPGLFELTAIANSLDQLQPVDDSNNHLGLYLADDLAAFDLLVPTSLPEAVKFVEARVVQEGGVVLHYEVNDALGVIADMYVIEISSAFGNQYTPIHTDTDVQEVSKGEFYGEYVQGDWQQTVLQESDGSSTETWSWNDSAPVRRLRFTYNLLSVSILYIGRPTEIQPETTISLGRMNSAGEWQEWNPERGLDKEELVQIALGVAPLPAYLPSSTAYISYRVEEGDTCSGIAANYGTSIEALASLNNLDSGCDLIRTGDVLIIPMYSQRLDLDQADLDCDGANERVQAFPIFDVQPQGQMRAIYLQDLSDMGLFKDVWQVTTRDEAADSLSYPQLVDLGNCQIFVTFQKIVNGQPELRIYRWSAGHMEPIFAQGREIVAVDPGSGTLVIREQIVDAASGMCQSWDVMYMWDGENLVETERTIDPSGGSCQ